MESFLAAARAFGTVHWGFLVVLAGLSVLHYVLAALTLRAVAPCRVPLGEATMAQFTAAAANRITPAGLGAAAVNTRYLVSLGAPATRAMTSVVVMQVAGAIADLLLLLAILSLGQGGNAALQRLGDRAAGLPRVPALIVGVLAGAAALFWAVRSPAFREGAAVLADLSRRPADLCVTLVASASTTLVLGVALALSVLAVPATGMTGADLPALVVAYMLGSAAGAALPAPGGLGGTEAALVVTVTALGVAVAPTIQSVLLFRAITYWAPVPVGLLTARTLRAKVSA